MLRRQRIGEIMQRHKTPSQYVQLVQQLLQNTEPRKEDKTQNSVVHETTSTLL
jgi:hypothetical protein